MVILKCTAFFAGAASSNDEETSYTLKHSSATKSIIKKSAISRHFRTFANPITG